MELKTENWFLIMAIVVVFAGAGLFMLNEWHEERHDLNAITAKEINTNNIVLMDSAMAIARKIKIDTILSKQILNALKGRYVVRTKREMDSIIEANRIVFDGLFRTGYEEVVTTPSNYSFDSIPISNEWTTSFDLKYDTLFKGVVLEHGINKIEISDLEGVGVNPGEWFNFIIASNDDKMDVYKNGVLEQTINDRPKDSVGSLQIRFLDSNTEIKNFKFWIGTKSDFGVKEIFENRDNYKL